MLTEIQGKCIQTYIPDYVLFDLETTGCNHHLDSIIEISAVKVRNGREVACFSSLVNPGRPIPWQASQVNNITDEMVAGEPVLSQVLPEFLDFIGDDVLAGHNIAHFDMFFLYRDCQKLFGKTLGNSYLDTLQFARNHLSGMENYKLTTLAAHYGLSTVGAHRALADCRMNQQVLEHLNRETPAAPVKCCPRCGNPMKKRSGRFGDFLGCTGYPNCRYTENI